MKIVHKDHTAIALINCGNNIFEWNIGSESSFKLTNNGVNESYIEYENVVANPIRQRLLEIYQLRSKFHEDQSALDSLNQLNKKISEYYINFVKAFISSYRNNFIALHLLRQNYMQFPSDTVKALYALLNKDFKNLPAALMLQDYLQVDKKHLDLNSLSFFSGSDAVKGYQFYLVQIFEENNIGSSFTEYIPAFKQLKQIHSKYESKGLQLISIAYEKKNGKKSFYSPLAESSLIWPLARIKQTKEKKTLLDDL